MAKDQPYTEQEERNHQHLWLQAISKYVPSIEKFCLALPSPQFSQYCWNGKVKHKANDRLQKYNYLIETPSLQLLAT